MEIKNINIEEFYYYVYNAFIDDHEIIEYYDRGAMVKNTEEAINNVCDKIKSCYPDAKIYGVEIDSIKVGYFVTREDLLISFGMALRHRNKITLAAFWEQIKSKLGNKFAAMLYSHNIRAINFLKKGGMKIEVDHITVLSYN